MTHIHADDRIKEIVHEFRHSEGESEVWGRYREMADALRHSEGAGMDDWHDTLAPGFEKREGMVQGRMIGRAILMAGISAWIIIGILAALQAFFPGAFA